MSPIIRLRHGGQPGEKEIDLHARQLHLAFRPRVTKGDENGRDAVMAGKCAKHGKICGKSDRNVLSHYLMISIMGKSTI